MSDSFRLVEDLIPTPMKTRARISRKQTGESIPSIHRTSGKLRLPTSGDFQR
jgi:hypothetical protein